MSLISLDDARTAAKRIESVAVRTPLLPAAWAGDLWCKAENLQPVGVFKIRGVTTWFARRDPADRDRGVITHSSGNHARAVAYAAHRFGVPALVVMPDVAPAIKVDAVRELGAEVVLVPPAEREPRAIALATERGYQMVAPYDDLAIIAGQATVGLEILADLPDADVVLVPVSGGGLIAGVATAVKALRPSCQVIGVEPELAADARDSLRAGERVGWDVADSYRTIADGLRVPRIGALPWEHIRRYVDDVVTVSEDEIRAAVRALAVNAHLVAEPSGAVTTAAHLYRGGDLPAGTRVAVISGGNIPPDLLADILTATGSGGYR